MADQHRPADLAPIYARLAAQDAVITHLRRRKRLPRRVLPLVLAALLVALVPLATLAATPFTDLTGGPHDGNIDLIYNAGITKGCDTTAYCPTANVTREEMASFLARAAGLGGNPPIANAKTAQTATTAGNAATVGGLAPNAFARVARSARTGAYIPLNTTGIPINSVTVTPSGPGFVLVTATAFFSVDPAGGRRNDVEAYIQDTGATGAGSRSPVEFVSIAYGQGYAYGDHLTLTWVFPVSGTLPRIFQLVARQSFTPNGVNYNQVTFLGDGGLGGTMTALFVPFAQDGGTTLAP